jgi:hypothetical protein
MEVYLEAWAIKIKLTIEPVQWPMLAGFSDVEKNKKAAAFLLF